MILTRKSDSGLKLWKFKLAGFSDDYSEAGEPQGTWKPCVRRAKDPTSGIIMSPGARNRRETQLITMLQSPSEKT